MKNLILGSLIFISLNLQAQSSTTNYELSIINDLGDTIPARISFQTENDTTFLIIKNSTDNIKLPEYKQVDDTAFFKFIDYNAEIALKKIDDAHLHGYWINYESAISNKRTVFATKSDSKTNDKAKNNPLFSGKWKVQMGTDEHHYPGLAVFETKGDKITGTIRTNSGDYRFLEGKITNEQKGYFYLSSFSGNSAFLLKGSFKGYSLTGKMIGIKSNTDWIHGVKDDNYDLPNADLLTKVVNNQPFKLDLPDENGVKQNFEKLTKGKVTIVSIFGTWCPNCVDETNYFKELKKKFPQLEIITVAFEATSDPLQQQKRVQGFKKRKDITNIQFLLAGKYGTENVMSKFPMIDKFGGYPTSFLLDKKGKIVEVHTGFNGPATGMVFERFKEEYEAKIRKLIAQ